MTQVWICASGLFGATVIGAILGFTIKNLSHKCNDMILGFCAGIMLSASVVGLIMPAFDQSPAGNWWIIAASVMGGALFLNILDIVTPHLHRLTGLDPEKHSHNSTINRILLFVMAIALHKLPEGMAAGVSISDNADGTASWAVSFGIALQNIPEGMVVIAPLLLAGVTRMRTFIISVCIGVLEIAGVLTGYALGSMSSAFLPAMLAFAGGAMLYVTSDEMIPETHAHGYQKQATYALILGFITLILLDKMFQ